jgi:hypothetical protein
VALFQAVSGLALAETIPSDEASFSDYVAQAIRREVGDTPVTVKSALSVSVGPLQANLDRLYKYCRSNDWHCDAQIDQFAKGASQALKNQNAPVDKQSVRLVIRSAEYIKHARANFGADAPTFQTKPFVEDLIVVAVLDTPRAVRPLDDRDLKALGMTPEQLFEVAAENMRKSLKPILERAKPVPSGQIGTVTGSYFDVGRVAMHDEWAPLAAAQNGILLVAVPATDTVLYVSEVTPTAVDALRTFAKRAANTSSGALSGVVLKWTPERWEVVQ